MDWSHRRPLIIKLFDDNFLNKLLNRFFWWYVWQKCLLKILWKVPRQPAQYAGKNSLPFGSTVTVMLRGNRSSPILHLPATTTIDYSFLSWMSLWLLIVATVCSTSCIFCAYLLLAPSSQACRVRKKHFGHFLDVFWAFFGLLRQSLNYLDELLIVERVWIRKTGKNILCSNAATVICFFFWLHMVAQSQTWQASRKPFWSTSSSRSLEEGAEGNYGGLIGTWHQH